MRIRKLKSIKEELVRKSREATLAAVQVYNNPHITFKSETYITLMVIAWIYLLHAYYRFTGIDYRYFKTNGKRKKYDRTKSGAYKYWELERCLNCDDSPVDDDSTRNLTFLIGIRHEIEHQMTNRIDEHLSAKLQACAINYNYYLCLLFGDKQSVGKELALSIQFAPISPEQEEQLLDNSKLPNNVINFIATFENKLTDEQIINARYAYRLLFVPLNANRKGQADRVIEFVRADSPLAEGLTKEYALVKETERKKYLPMEIVRYMQCDGYPQFGIQAHTNLWKELNAKDPSKGYGVQVSKTWYWYESWLNVVVEHCKDNKIQYGAGGKI
jgi:hypothetical protein